MTASPVGEEDKVIEAQVQSSEAEQAVRILRIEDDQNLAELVAEFLERKRDRFDVITETDPRDGLEAKGRTLFMSGVGEPLAWLADASFAHAYPRRSKPMAWE